MTEKNKIGFSLKSKPDRLKAIDLFSGCGGLTEGLKKANFDVIAAIEIDSKARHTYALNHPNVWLAGTDIRNVDPIELLNRLNLKVGELDLLAGCPPCQGFSRMRKMNKRRSARDDRNMLIDDFAKFSLAIRPKLIMMENVPGLADYHRFQDFIRALQHAGYKVKFEVLNVADYGVPQRRKRLIVSASRVGEPSVAPVGKKRLTVRDAIEKLPVAGMSGDALHDMPETRSERIQNLINAIPRDGGSRNDLPDELILDCHRVSNGYSDVYGRMAWDEVAPTITGGCFNPSKGRFLHPEHNRAITLREASLLQGFPRNYLFDVAHGKEAIALMIGNALPPPFIAAHAKKMAKALITHK
jgi:DNA (cytosine-5)-methyltransferase 1